MRPGTRIQRYEVTACDLATAADLREYTGPVGSIYSADLDWRDRPTLGIRWDDGRLETIRPDDENADWCFDDVTPRLFVNVYLWDRCYGGPEEGGWWYDAYTPEADQCTQQATEADAAACLDRMLDWCEQQNAERHHPSSSISDGHFVVRVESWPPEPEPAGRPRYE